MFSMKKYKLLPAEAVVAVDGQTYEVHRIKALVDIPRHNVKAGDLGGFVSHEKILSQKGSCWVGGDAIAANPKWQTRITENALVEGQAFISGNASGTVKIHGRAQVRGTVSGRADISGNAFLGYVTVDGNVVIKENARIIDGTISTQYRGFVSGGKGVVISGDVIVNCPSVRTEYIGVYDKFINLASGESVEISGKVRLNNSFISGDCKLDGEFSLDSASLKGNNTIIGSHKIKPDVKFTGTNVITGNSVIPPGTHVHDVVMDGGVLNYADADFAGNNPAVSAPSKTDAVEVAKPAAGQYISLIGQIEAEYEAYTTDVVKLIKYPAMVDASIPEVGEFLVRLRSAKRVMDTASVDTLVEVSGALELAFVRAENKCRTLVASHLDDAKKKALKDASKKFEIACDEASTEPEKKLGFRAGMRALEGVIEVSDAAVAKMKERAGLLEIEA